MDRHDFLKNLGNETKTGHWLVSFQVILIDSGLFSMKRRQGQT